MRPGALAAVVKSISTIGGSMVKPVLATLLVFVAGCGVSKDEFAAQQRDAQQNLKNYQAESEKSAALEKKVADLQAQNAALQSQLGELTATSARLQQEKGALEAKSAQYQQLASSRSEEHTSELQS